MPLQALRATEAKNDTQGLQLKILDKISEIYNIHNFVVLHDNFLIFMEYQD